MKTHPKRTLLAWLLTAAMLLSLLPTAALAASGEEEETAAAEAAEVSMEEETADETASGQGYRLNDDAATSGTCGDDVTWTLEDGVLTISGTGEMTSHPWGDYVDQIQTVVIENGVTSIDSWAFLRGHNLTSVTLPDSMTSIGWGAFKFCTSLTSIVIPNSVTSIGIDAFSGCTSLTNVTIGTGLTFIGSNAFEKCALTSITIPAGVTYIGSDAFLNCTALTEIQVSAENEVYCSEDGVLFNKDMTNLIWYPGGNLRNQYDVPEGVKALGSNSFLDCTELSILTLPASLTSIDDSLMIGCTGLTEIQVSSSNETYYTDANRVLYNKDMTELICCPDKSIGAAFYVPASVTSIGDYAFYGCTGYLGTYNIILNDSLVSIGDYAFAECANLANVTFGSGLSSIGEGAFENCTGLTSVTIPDGVTSIGNSAFSGCTGLTSVTIPDSVTSINSSAFEDCTSLTSVTIPDSVTSINSSAFEDCTSLTSITIPDGVTSIGSYAFSGCTSLTSITIPDGVTDIDYNTFSYCTGLTNVTIPDSVTSIGGFAFEGCTGLTSVTIPDSVTSIGQSVFQGCEALTDVTIPDSVTSIGNRAFYGCTSLTSITIGSSVTTIADYAFYDCSGLTSITIPDSVTDISYRAFYRCASLTDVYYAGSESDWDSISIDSGNGCLTSATIHFNSTGPEEEEPHTHSYTSTVTKAATCGEDGVMTYTCSECGASYTEAIPATGNHTAGEVLRENEVEATATENGSYDNVVYCAVCGEEISRETITVPATGSEDHTHSWTGAVTTPATCTTDGVMTYTCAECGASYTEAIPATGHTWDEGVVTLAPTRVTEGEKTCTCTVCGETTTENIPVLTGADAEFLFDDVTSGDAWYYDAVYWAYDLGITAGYEDGTFRPNSNCTRAEFATFLYTLARAYGVENAGDTASRSFTDVAEGSWYYTYVMWAAENGLVSGYSDGTFKPNKEITRAEAVTMLYGFYKTFVNGGVAPELEEETENTFSDLSEDSWYYTYMLWAIQNDIVSGYPDGTCRPTTSCTRSVMVVLLYATAGTLL